MAVILGVLCATLSASASDVWVLLGTARLPGCPGEAKLLIWRADALLRNTSEQGATVRSIEISNGGTGAGQETVIPPGETRAAGRTIGGFAPAHLWLTHLDVPEGVAVEGRLEFLFNDCTLRSQPTAAVGKFALPVFRELTPAGKRTMHGGVDLGIQNTRLNVGVYNAGSAFATAIIEVFRSGCPLQPPVVAVVPVPPQALTQTSVFELPPRCTQDASIGDWVAHAVVTVDQPSLSYAVALSNEADPRATVGFAQ